MAGDNVGILLRGIQKTEIECGMVLSKPGTIVSKILTIDIIYKCVILYFIIFLLPNW
mgnify:CR=1 FL=1